VARPVRAGCCSPRSVPGLEVATIVRAHGAAVRQQQALSREQRHALRSIAVCRTPALGGHLDVCSQCGFERPAYHSGRNRHCPKCQSLAQARWIEQRMARVLDVDYFHVVFTLPAALRSLTLAHPCDPGPESPRRVRSFDWHRLSCPSREGTSNDRDDPQDGH